MQTTPPSPQPHPLDAILEPEWSQAEYDNHKSNVQILWVRCDIAEAAYKAANKMWDTAYRQLEAENALRKRNAERRAMWQALHGGGAQ